MGVLGSAAARIELGRLHLCQIQFYLASLWSSSLDRVDDRILIHLELVQHLRWWLDQDHLREGVPLTPLVASLQLNTDGSLSGCA